MRTAIYARFSSDKQSENSIDDQFRNCLRRAERDGMTVVARFEDRAISGASNNRPGYKEMLAAAADAKFDILLVDDLSRLSRDEIETKQVIRRFKFADIRIVGASDGYDSADKGEKIQSTMRGLMNELYLDDLREKTHRGMTGQALKGLSAGGRTYGYHSVRISSHKADGRPESEAARREINPDEKEWVVKIFEWFANGDSPKRIADKLNRLGVKSPRGSTWAASAIYGDYRDGTGLLNNQLYIGQYVWNRSEWRKDPDSGNRRRIKREEKDWVRKPMPELRIISPELWEAVQTRHNEIRQRSQHLRAVLNNPATKSRSGKYLFSGLMQCGCCGASYTVYSSTSYGCSTNLNRGDAACDNRLRIPRKMLEVNLLEIIRKDLLSKESIEMFVHETKMALREKQAEIHPNTKADERRLETAGRQIANIMAAIQQGIITPTTKEALQRAEAEQIAAQEALEANAKASAIITTVLPEATERYRAMIKNLGRSLSTDVAHARQCLKGLLGPIRLIPSAGRDYLEAELRHSADGLMRLALGDTFKVQVVAGARFELTTFRL